MRKILEDFQEIMDGFNSVLDVVDEVEAYRLTLDKEDELTFFVNAVRVRVQIEAEEAVIEAGGIGMVVMATGTGKSKVAVELAKYYHDEYQDKFALVVPTEKLRDENWKEEFYKWNAHDQWCNITSLCYASGSKIKDKRFKLVILDEGHNITGLSSQFFANNAVENIVLLTATRPTNTEKIEILDRLNIPIVYEVTLDQAVRLGFVAPYKITVVTVPLEKELKDVAGGNKANPFMTTEEKMYEYLTKRVDTSPLGTKGYQFAILGRMQFIYKLKSKTRVMKYLLDNVIPLEDRTLVFCGNIAQADDVLPTRYHSKSGDKDYDAFKAEEINRLSCVKAINEGHNFPGIDSGIIGQLSSKEKDLVQRIGRLIRFRPGHEAHIWILVAEGTQDMKWLETATEGLDQSKIERMSITELKSRKL